MPLDEIQNSHLPTLAQADLVFLLGHGFASPVDQANWQLGDVSATEIRHLIVQTGWNESDDIAAEANAWIALLADLSVAAHSDEYHRLFEGAIVCPLNETAYVRRDKGAIIGDLCGFYRAFGWQPRIGTGEKPDHIVVELQFLAVLLTMLAQAQHQGDSEHIDLTLDAIRKLGSDHLGDWLPTLADNLEATTHVDSFRRLAFLLRRVWNALVEQFAIAVTPPDDIQSAPVIPTLSRGDDLEGDSPYEPCGFETAPGLVQIQQSRGQS